MRKFWILVCTIVFGSALTISQATSNAGGGQTSSPGTGQPGTGNVPGTGTGQGSGAEIPATAQAKTKAHKRAHTNIIKRAQKPSRDPTLAARTQNDMTVTFKTGKRAG